MELRATGDGQTELKQDKKEKKKQKILMTATWKLQGCKA